MLDQNWVAAVAEHLGVKNDNNEFHYCLRNIRCYSQAFVDKVCERLKQDPDLVKTSYAARKQKRGGAA